MKRLRDRTDPLSPIEAEAIVLLRSAEPFQPASGAKQRVRLRLLARSAATPPRLIRPVVVIASLLAAAGASAAIGGVLVARRQAGQRHVEAATRTDLSDLVSTSGARPTASTNLLDSSLSPVAVAERAEQARANDSSLRDPRGVESNTAGATKHLPAQHAEVVKRGAVVAAKPLGGMRRAAMGPREADGTPPILAKQPTAAKSVTGNQTEDVKLVFDAMRALRRDGQAELASRQLAEYMGRSPEGTLAEEALALAIEAASVRGDPRAKELAVKYLARYPAGRFQKLAERARARFAP